MFEILTVCTGNICRSPLAELLLRERLAGLPGRVHSAGTYDLGSAPMSSDAQRLAVGLGVPSAAAAAHRSSPLMESTLSSPDLVLVMTREHRRHVLELAPARMRSVFTVREFERLAAPLSDDEVVSWADDAGSDPSARVRAAASLVASNRGMVPASRPEDEDVIDPYRRSWDTYQLSASQLLPGIEAVARVVRLAVA
ncbi:MAG: hypothetical protein QM713_09325 [Arachnia sp.]